MNTTTEPKTNERELRELDAWIAIHLFGWMPETRKMYGGEKNAKGFGLNQHLSLGSPDRNFLYEYSFPPFNYSTDPAASMQVLEKCIVEQRKLHAGDACFFFSKDGSEFWLRTVVNNKHLDGQAETLPLAIARFAKKLFSE